MVRIHVACIPYICDHILDCTKIPEMSTLDVIRFYTMLYNVLNFAKSQPTYFQLNSICET